MPDLRGMLVQNGPGIFDAPWGRVAHPFDAGGVLRGVRLDGDRAEVAIAPVLTADLASIKQQGEAYTRSAPRPWWRFMPSHARNVANTHVVPWDKGLLALFEHGVPTRVDPDSLETQGPDDLGGLVRRSFTAHPRIVPENDTLYGFDLRYGLLRTTLVVIAWTTGQRPRELLRVPLAGTPFMLHDFAATPKHLVFVVPPVQLDSIGLLRNRAPICELERWEPERGAEVIVVPLADPAKFTRFTVDPFWFWHVGNAWEDGDDIAIDLVRYPDYRSASWLAAMYQGPPGFTTGSTHARIRVSPGRRALDVLWEGGPSSEFPTVDPRCWGERTDVVWSNAHSSVEVEEAGPQDTLLRIDHAAGTVESIAVGPGCYPGEPVIVADRAGSSWVLSTVLDTVANESFVGVWDERGTQVASVRLGQALPIAFHGSWLPGVSRLG